MTSAAHQRIYDDIFSKASSTERAKAFQLGPWNAVAACLSTVTSTLDESSVYVSPSVSRQLTDAAENAQFMLTCVGRREALIDELQAKLDAVIKTCARCSAQVESVLRDLTSGVSASASPDAFGSAAASFRNNGAERSTLPSDDSGTVSPTTDHLQLSQSTAAPYRPNARQHGILRNAAAVLKSVASTNAEWIVLRNDATTMTATTKSTDRMTSTVDLEKQRIARLITVEVQVAPEPFRAEIVRLAGDKLRRIRQLHWHRAFARLQWSQAIVAPGTSNPATASKLVVLRYSRYADVVRQQLDLLNSIVSNDVSAYKTRGTHYVDVVEEYTARRERLAKRADDALKLTNGYIFSSLKCVQLKRTESKNILNDVVHRLQTAATDAEAARQRAGSSLVGVPLPAMSTLPAPLEVLHNKDSTAWLLSELPSTMKLALKHWQESVKRLRTRKPHLFVHTLDAPSGAVPSAATRRSPSPRSPTNGTDDDVAAVDEGVKNGTANGGGASPSGALIRSHRYDHVAPRVFEDLHFERGAPVRSPHWGSAVPVTTNKWSAVTVSPPSRRQPRLGAHSSKVAQLLLPPPDSPTATPAALTARPVTTDLIASALTPLRLPLVPQASHQSAAGASLRTAAAPTTAAATATKASSVGVLCAACQSRGSIRPCGRPDCANGGASPTDGRRTRSSAAPPQQQPRTFFTAPPRAADLNLALHPGDESVATVALSARPATTATAVAALESV